MKKNAAKLAKNAWLAMDKIKENSMPNAAPDLLTDFLRSAIVISVSGANVENNQRIGGITDGSRIRKYVTFNYYKHTNMPKQWNECGGGWWMMLIVIYALIYLQTHYNAKISKKPNCPAT